VSVKFWRPLFGLVAMSVVFSAGSVYAGAPPAVEPRDTPGVVRASGIDAIWYLRSSNDPACTVPASQIGFGAATDTPLSADLDGDGLDQITIYRQQTGGTGGALVFATSQNFQVSGLGGGLAGADTVCTNAAAAAGLSGSWTAWLSDSSTDARDRIADTEYRLLNGTLVASSLADLTDETLTAPINQDENGVTLDPKNTWTGTAPDGTATVDHCSDWTDDTAGSSATVGDATQTGVGWTALASTNPCDFQRGLYCFSGPLYGEFFVRANNTTPVATNTRIAFGTGPDAGDIPVAGNFDPSSAADEVGVYRRSTQEFFLDDGVLLPLRLGMGDPGDIPVVGNWDDSADGSDEVGVYRPSNNVFYLRDNLNPSDPSNTAVPMGAPSDVPAVGDFDRDGATTVGVFRDNGFGTFYLRNSLTSSTPTITVNMGAGSDTPVTGDWDGPAADGVGCP
jgi:hypothetical protein